MAFTVKDWENYPSTDTPISEAALEDLEDRVTDYADSVAAAGVELGYAEITTTATQGPGIGSANVSGLSVTVTVASRPIVVEFGCSLVYNDTSGGSTVLKIKESSTQLDTQNHIGTTTLTGFRGRMRRRLTPSAGDHTYVIEMAQGQASRTSSMSASADAPAWISVTEV